MGAYEDWLEEQERKKREQGYEPEPLQTGGGINAYDEWLKATHQQEPDINPSVLPQTPTHETPNHAPVNPDWSMNIYEPEPVTPSYTAPGPNPLYNHSTASDILAAAEEQDRRDSYLASQQTPAYQPEPVTPSYTAPGPNPTYNHRTASDILAAAEEQDRRDRYERAQTAPAYEPEPVKDWEPEAPVNPWTGKPDAALGLTRAPYMTVGENPETGNQMVYPGGELGMYQDQERMQNTGEGFLNQVKRNDVQNQGQTEFLNYLNEDIHTYETAENPAVRKNAAEDIAQRLWYASRMHNVEYTRDNAAPGTVNELEDYGQPGTSPYEMAIRAVYDTGIQKDFPDLFPEEPKTFLWEYERNSGVNRENIQDKSTEELLKKLAWYTDDVNKVRPYVADKDGKNRYDVIMTYAANMPMTQAQYDQFMRIASATKKLFAEGDIDIDVDKYIGMRRKNGTDSNIRMMEHAKTLYPEVDLGTYGELMDIGGQTAVSNIFRKYPAVLREWTAKGGGYGLEFLGNIVNGFGLFENDVGDWLKKQGEKGKAYEDPYKKQAEFEDYLRSRKASDLLENGSKFEKWSGNFLMSAVDAITEMMAAGAVGQYARPLAQTATAATAGASPMTAATRGAKAYLNLAQNASNYVMSTFAAANKYSQIYGKDSPENVFMRTLATGFLEYQTNTLFGGNPLVDPANAGRVPRFIAGLTENPTVQKLVSSKVTDFIQRLSGSRSMNYIGEGLEEVASYAGDAAMDYVFTGEMDLSAQEMMNEFIVGTVLSLLVEGGSRAVEAVSRLPDFVMAHTYSKFSPVERANLSKLDAKMGQYCTEYLCGDEDLMRMNGWNEDQIGKAKKGWAQAVSEYNSAYSRLQKVRGGRFWNQDQGQKTAENAGLMVPTAENWYNGAQTVNPLTMGPAGMKPQIAPAEATAGNNAPETQMQTAPKTAETAVNGENQKPVQTSTEAQEAAQMQENAPVQAVNAEVQTQKTTETVMEDMADIVKEFEGIKKLDTGTAEAQTQLQNIAEQAQTVMKNADLAYEEGAIGQLQRDNVQELLTGVYNESTELIEKPVNQMQTETQAPVMQEGAENVESIGTDTGRNVRMDPGRTAGRLGESGPQRTSDGGRNGNGGRDAQADLRARLQKFQNLEATTSSADLFETGTDDVTLAVIPEDLYDTEMREAAQEARNQGLGLTYVTGAMMAKTRSGREIRINGVSTDDGRIIVSATDLMFSPMKLARHEMFHEKARKDQGMVTDLWKQIKKDYDWEQLQPILNEYVQAYRGTVKSLEGIWEEIEADAYAGMNRFRKLDTGFLQKPVTDYTEGYSAEQRTESKRGPPEENGVRYSGKENALNKDSQGRDLSEGQQKKFQESQVRSKDGNLMPMYHATNADFTEFERNKIGSSGAGQYIGYGFNFAAIPATQYGKNVMEVYLDIKHPLSDREKTLTSWDVTRILKNIDKATPEFEEDVSNSIVWEFAPTGYNISPRDSASTVASKYQNAVRGAAESLVEYAESDADLYSSISVAAGSPDAVIDSFKNYKSFQNKNGFDGILWHNQDGNIQYAVTFDSNQAKNVDNLNPTEDPDVRYSLSDEELEEERLRGLLGEAEADEQAFQQRETRRQEKQEPGRPAIKPTDRITETAERILGSDADWLRGERAKPGRYPEGFHYGKEKPFRSHYTFLSPREAKAALEAVTGKEWIIHGDKNGTWKAVETKDPAGMSRMTMEEAMEKIRKNIRKDQPETRVNVEGVRKADFKGSPAMEALGIKIDGSITDYTATKAIVEREKAARKLKKQIERTEKRLGAKKKEKDLAREISRGESSYLDIPDTMDYEKVVQLATAYQDLRMLGEDLRQKRKTAIRDSLYWKALNMMPDNQEIMENPELFHHIKLSEMNKKTAQRNMLKMFGPDKGAELNAWLFDPVNKNEAERIRWVNRQFDRVRTFTDSNGKKSPLNKAESAYVHMMLDAEGCVERIKADPQHQDIQDAAYNVSRGENAVEVADEFGLNAEQSKLMRQYAEWMAVENGENKNIDTVKVKNAAKLYRQIFDEFYEAAVDFLASHGDMPIGKIEYYTPHISTGDKINLLSTVLEKIGMNQNVTELPVEIAGMTAEFKPTKRWTPFFLHRKGDKTDYDIVQGFESYVTYLSDVLFHHDDIQKLRAVENVLRGGLSGSYGTELQEAIDLSRRGDMEEAKNWLLDRNSNFLEAGQQWIDEDTEYSKNAVHDILDQYIEKLNGENNNPYRYSSLVQWLNNYANILAGKQYAGDRGAEQDQDRKSLNLGNKAARTFARANIAGNFSTAFNQTAQVENIIGERTQRAITHAIADLFSGKAREFAKESDYLTGKKGIDYIDRTMGEKMLTASFIPMEVVDGIVSYIAVKSGYYDGIRMGMNHEEALEFGDKFARKIMSDRTKGAKPLRFYSKKFWSQMFNMFQIEPKNTWDYFFDDIPAEYKKTAKEYGKPKAMRKLISTIVKTLLAAFVINRISEELYGGTPAPMDLIGLSGNFVASGKGLTTNDYIRKLINKVSVQMFGDEVFDDLPDEKEDFDLQAAAEDTVWNVSNEIPFLANISSALGLGDRTLPMPHILEKIGALAESAIKEGPLSEEAGEDAVALLAELMPGGRQLKKTVSGAKDLIKGGAFRGSGEDEQLKYPVDDSIFGILQNLVFGANATNDAKAYWASDKSPLSARQTNTWKMLKEEGVDEDEAYWLMEDLRDVGKNKDMTSNEKKKEQRKIINDCDFLTDEQKAYVYSQTFGTKDENGEIGTTHDATFDELMETGMSWSDCMDVYEKYRGLYENEDLDGKQQDNEMAVWLDSSDYSEEQRDIIRDGFEINADWYYKLTDTGIPSKDAKAITDKIQGTKNATVYDKTRIVLDQHMGENDTYRALGAVLTESTFDKLTEAKQEGFTCKTYMDYMQKKKGIKSDKDEDGKTISGSKKKKIMELIDSLNITDDQKTFLYLQEGYAENTLSDAPWYVSDASDNPFEFDYGVFG